MADGFEVLEGAAQHCFKLTEVRTDHIDMSRHVSLDHEAR